MLFLILSLFAGGIVILDQVSKYFTVAAIPLYGHHPFLHGFVCFTYHQNKGAAFSSFEGQQWLFALIFVIFTVMIFWEYFKTPMPFTKFERFCIAAVYGGGLGNMIDRVRLGYVVDMIKTEFIDFAIFNVADCFITCGCIALMISLVFFNKEFWKEEKK